MTVHVPMGLPHSMKWARGGETCDWRAAAPNLFVFVHTATCTMRRQDLTPDIAHSQHPCMQVAAGLLYTLGAQFCALRFLIF